MAGAHGGVASAGPDACGADRGDVAPSLALDGDVGHRGVEYPHEVTGCDADVEPALAAADVNGVEQQRDLVDHGRQALLLTERADPTAHVPGDALGDCRVA